MTINDVDQLRPVLILEPEVLALLPDSRGDPAVETFVCDTFEATVRAPDGDIVVAGCASPCPYRRLSSAAGPSPLI